MMELEMQDKTSSMYTEEFIRDFSARWNSVADDVHHVCVEKGFWEQGEDRNVGEMLALIHAEISEALEGYRNGNPPDEKVPAFSNVEIELADTVIRLMDLSKGFGWRVPEAIFAKMCYNETRPYKHGRKF